MDEQLRSMHESLVVKERLQALAELQAGYWDELTARGFDSSVAEQLLLDWSRHAYPMTLRALPEPDISLEIDGLLIAPDGPEATHEARAADPADDASADPSSVPAGEPWLQLVCEPATTEDDADCDGGEQRAA